MKKILLILTFLLLFSSFVYAGDLSIKKIEDSQWTLNKISGEESSLEIIYVDKYDKKTDIYIVEKPGMTTGKVDKSLYYINGSAVYDEQGKKIKVKWKNNACDINGTLTDCYLIKLKDSEFSLLDKNFKLGEHSLVNVYQNISTVQYIDDSIGLVVNHTLLKWNGENYVTAPEDIWIKIDKFGGNDTAAKEDTNYSYIVTSNKHLFQDKEGFYVSSNGGYRDYLNLNDICVDGANCELRHNESNKLIVTFTAFYNETLDMVVIDPKYVTKQIEANILLENIRFEPNVNVTHSEIDNSTTPFNSLLGYWSFDINISPTTTYDSYIHDFDGTYSGDATSNTTDCIYDSCLKLDGNGDYVTIGDDDRFDGNGSLSWSIWFKTETDRSVFLFSKNNGGAASGGWGSALDNAWVPDSVDCFMFGGGKYLVKSQAQTYFDNNWHLLTCTWNASAAGNDRLKMYYDGVEGGSYSTNTLVTRGDNAFDIIISGRSGATLNPLNGSVDEAMIFNETLTGDDVLNIYNNRSKRFKKEGIITYSFIYNNTNSSDNMMYVALLNAKAKFNTSFQTQVSSWEVSDGYNETDENIVSYYHFDGSPEDSVGNNDGTTTTGVSNYTNVLDKGYNFNGTGACMDIDLDAFDNLYETQKATISAWYTRNGTNTNRQTIFSAEGWFYIQFNLNADDKIGGGYDGSGLDNVVSDNTIADGETVHVVMTHDSGTTSLYINGILDDTASKVMGDITSTSRNTTFGSNYQCGNFFLNGTIDESMVWNKSLSAEEVKKLYIKERPNWKKSGWYDMIKGTGDNYTVSDITINGTNYLVEVKLISNDSWYTPYNMGTIEVISSADATSTPQLPIVTFIYPVDGQIFNFTDFYTGPINVTIDIPVTNCSMVNTTDWDQDGNFSSTAFNFINNTVINGDQSVGVACANTSAHNATYNITFTVDTTPAPPPIVGSTNLQAWYNFTNNINVTWIDRDGNLWTLGGGNFSGNVYDNTNRVCTAENGICNQTFIINSSEFIIYIAMNGNDTSGTGTVNNPYRKIQFALDETGDAQTTVEYEDENINRRVFNIGPGNWEENLTIPQRNVIIFNLQGSRIVGDINYTVDSSLGGSSHPAIFIIRADSLRGVHSSTSVPRIGIQGNITMGSTGTSITHLMMLNTGIRGNIFIQGTGGSKQLLTDNSNLIQGINVSGGVRGDLYISNADSSSSSSIGTVRGNVRFSSIKNVRFIDVVNVTGSSSGRWRNVQFASGKAHDFSGVSSSLSVDANSYASYYDNVDEKGTETFTLVDRAVGVGYIPANDTHWVLIPDNVKEALDLLANITYDLNETYVPYVNATKNINIGSYNLTTNETLITDKLIIFNENDTIGINGDIFLSLRGGANNLFLGIEAGKNVTTGAGNLFFGYQAGDDITTQDNNLVIGYQAGQQLKSDENTCIGYQACQTANATGANVLGVGFQACQNITDGDDNLCLGYQAGRSVTTGNNNVMIGENAGDGITSQSNTVAIGSNACGAGGIGSSNVCIGNGAGAATTEKESVFIGPSAGGSGSARRSVFLGSQTGQQNTGIGNLFMGYTTGKITTSVSNTVIMGHQAGGVLTTGDNNVLIGSNSEPNASNTAYAVALGQNSVAATREFTVSNVDDIILGDGRDNVKYWYGAGRNVSSYFDGDDMNFEASYGTPNFNFIGFNNTIFDSNVNVTGEIRGGFIDRYDNGNFKGSLYTSGIDSSQSISNSLFQIISDTRGTPQFQVQDGGIDQASFITRSFMVVNQNNTLLNSSENNNCSKWGFRHIDCRTGETGADMGVQDDFEVQGIVYTEEGIVSNSATWGPYFWAGEHFGILGIVNNGTDGEYNDNNQFFCDYKSKPFNNLTTQWLRIMNGTYEGAVADIQVYINDSCVLLHNIPAWDTNISNQTFLIDGTPVLTILDGGFTEMYVGDDPESQFKIKIKNGTGFSGVYIDAKAGVNQFQSLTVDTDGFNYDGIVGFNSYLYSSIPVNNRLGINTLLEIDGTGINNSEGRFIDMRLIGKPENSDVDGIEMDPNLNHLIEVGSADTINSAYYNAVNITENVTDVGNDAGVFLVNGDEVYIGNTGNFTTMGVSLSTVSSHNLEFNYLYCNNTNEYQIIEGVTDTTNGFKVSGSITFNNPDNRGKCFNQTDGTPFSDLNNYTYIVLQRNKNFVLIPPVINFLSISGATTNFILQKDLMKVNPVDTAPYICDATYLGSLYFDISEDQFCQCNSGGWKEMDDSSAECT